MSEFLMTRVGVCSKGPVLQLAVVCALLAGTCASRGEVVGSFVLNGDGTVTYFYEVDNRAGLFDISLWSLEFPFATPDWEMLDTFSGGDVEVPNTGWFANGGLPVTGESAQDFLSLDPASDVLLGETLVGFSFTSRFLPGSILYREFSAQGESVSGLTIGPVITTPVPEGEAWLAGLALAGVAGAAVVQRRGRTSLRAS
ncbi:MAG: hypothetical protein JNK85_10855 [Verrucomicrobiales bacterium]|nr:hypothetical protein [Verrucomicrobiales bacterium]